MSVHEFGRLPDGTPVQEIRLANGAGAEAQVLSFGATLRDLVVPVGDERRRVVLGFDSLEGYLVNKRYIGVTAGRHASRIDRGRLPIDGTVHQLSRNDGPHHLHGGVVGFSRKPWRLLDADAASVTLGLTSPDGDDGYPGALEVRCTYRLKEPATLSIVMTATTDAATAVSLAHHSYFRLLPGQDIRSHRLQVNAGRYVPFGPDMLPSGELPGVAGTPYDFRSPRPLAGADPAFTYDCCFVLDGGENKLAAAAALAAPDSSLSMLVYTTEPCLVLYDGAGLAPDHPGLDGAVYGPHAGLCLEAMRFPDNPNQPAFPSALLRPGEAYRQETEYRFVR